MTQLISLIYVSTASKLFSAEQLEQLVTKATNKNRQNDITGVLFYAQGNFLQLLEGAPDAVDALFEVIKKDGRHHYVTLLERTPINERHFPDWGMGCQQIDASRWEALRLAACNRQGMGYEVLEDFWRTCKPAGKPESAMEKPRGSGDRSKDSETRRDNHRILIVDDAQSVRMLHRSLLSQTFDVLTAASGREAIEMCQERLPDLVLMDADMPDMNGYETCRTLLTLGRVPVIFVTGLDSAEAQLDAFDAGAVDVVQKPVVADVLVRKIVLAIAANEKERAMLKEKERLRHMAMNFLSSMGHSGILLNFLKNSMHCRNYDALATQLLTAATELKIELFGAIRHATGTTHFSSRGDLTDFELGVLDRLSSMGKVFQFKSHLVVNYKRTTIVTTQLPIHSAADADRIKDDLTILAEATEALCDNVDMRQESMQRAEQLQLALAGAVGAVEALRGKHTTMLLDTRVLLQDLTDKVERSFSWLGVSADQERTLSDTMGSGVEKIIEHLGTSGQFDADFDQVIAALRGNTQADDNLELW